MRGYEVILFKINEIRDIFEMIGSKLASISTISRPLENIPHTSEIIFRLSHIF